VLNKKIAFFSVEYKPARQPNDTVGKKERKGGMKDRV